MTKTIAALTLAALALGAQPALAKGNGNAEERAKLKAELAEARKANGENPGPTLIERLFGFGEDEDRTKTAKNKAAN
ncbi:MAG: hypothetical protein AAFR17_07250 [Pseudomonadota bacterium]